MQIKIAIVCRANFYERLKKPIKNVEVSPPLTTWVEAISYAQNGLDGIVVEAGISFADDVKSLPFPTLVFEGNADYEVLAERWVNSLCQAKQEQALISQTRKNEIPNQVQGRTRSEHFVLQPMGNGENIRPALKPSKRSGQDRYTSGHILSGGVAAPKQNTEPDVFTHKDSKVSTLFLNVGNVVDRGREALQLGIQKGKVALTTKQSQGKETKPLAPKHWSSCVEQRVLVYSPKGSGGATSIILSLAEDFPVGVVEIAYPYGQMAGKLQIAPNKTINEVEVGMEEEAVWDNKYLFSPWIHPIRQPMDKQLATDWLQKAQCAFHDRLLLVDLMSRAPLPILQGAHNWATKIIWCLQDTEDHLGLAEFQLSHLQEPHKGKMGLFIQQTTDQKLPWEELLGVSVIGSLPRAMFSKEWKQQLHLSVTDWIMKSSR